MIFLCFNLVIDGDWSRPGNRGRVLCSVEEPGVRIGQPSSCSVWERVILVVGREHVRGYMAANRSHQPRRAYSFAYRLAKEGCSDFATDIRSACQLFEDREYHWGVSHIYCCGNRHTIGQPAHQQRYLQFESFLLLIPSYACAHANCL
jgi:hypothetical protein